LVVLIEQQVCLLLLLLLNVESLLMRGTVVMLLLVLVLVMMMMLMVWMHWEQLEFVIRGFVKILHERKRTDVGVYGNIFTVVDNEDEYLQLIDNKLLHDVYRCNKDYYQRKIQNEGCSLRKKRRARDLGSCSS
jgi:hypothetical protein